MPLAAAELAAFAEDPPSMTVWLSGGGGHGCIPKQAENTTEIGQERNLAWPATRAGGAGADSVH